MSYHSYLPEFDTLVALHSKDPAAFEELRRQLLRSCIDGAPEAHRPSLEALAQQIEVVRASAGTPMEAAIGASRLMVASCARLRDAMSDLSHATAELQTTLLLNRFRL